MAPVNQSRNQTAFTVSIEAKKGVTTGISARDRAKTIKIATKKNVLKKKSFSWPCISYYIKRWRCTCKSWSYRSIC